MSLIHEALKRARQETSRRDATQKGLPYPWLASDLPAGRPRVKPRRAVWIGAVLLLVSLLGLAVGLTYRWASRRPVQSLAETGPIPGSIPVTPATVTEAADDSERTQVADLAASHGPTATAESVPPPAPEAPAQRDDSGPEAKPSEAAQAGIPVAPSAAPPPREPEFQIPAVDTVEPKPVQPSLAAVAESFVRGMSREDGTKIDLSGIVWAAEPLVVLNGEILSVGDTIQGFRIEKIERDHVELRRSDEVVLIRLR